jgi:iron complex transport system substrate-binding protein
VTTTLPIDREFARIVDELTRRGFLGGALGSAALLGLGACSSGSSPSSSTSATRTVSSVHGAVTVPDRPTRVVTLDSYTMGALFDLGLDPVGVYSAGEQYVEPQFLAKWRKIAKISAGTVGGAIQVEKVAALQPDLIIGIDAQKPPYDQLKAIAPTVVVSFAGAAPWRTVAQTTATTVGRTAAFTSLADQLAKKAASIRSTHASVLAATTWDVLQGGFDDGQYWLYGPGTPVVDILTSAGVRLASGSEATKEQRTVSYEKIPLLGDADAIFYYRTNTGQPANLGPQLFAQPLFTKLDAVRTKRTFGSVYFLPSCYSDALGLLDALDSALTELGRSGG